MGQKAPSNDSSTELTLVLVTLPLKALGGIISTDLKFDKRTISFCITLGSASCTTQHPDEESCFHRKSA